MRRPAVCLYGAAAGAGAAGVGAVHLGERLPRGGALRHPLQLVPVPGELLRPRALRMDARELERCGSTARPAPYAAKHLKLVFEEFDYGFIYKRVREGQTEGDPVWTVGPRDAVAERLLSRQPFRMAGADRRREHAQRLLVLHARAEGARALRAGQGSDLGEPDQGRATAAGSRATSSTRTSSPGSGRARSPTAPRKISAPATSASR